MKSVKEVSGDESDVYDGLRLRFSIYTYNRVLEFRSGTTSDTALESLRDRTGDIR
ncbi:MAG: hypothetical protein V7K27_21285 [Nostoc sp.]|uniref:hypothetical protein n=1 Tax=Nostoc sp. TaxID=1180 RepID=UPI002FFBE72A